MKSKVFLFVTLIFLISSSFVNSQSLPLFDLPAQTSLIDSNTNLPEGIVEQISINQVPKVPNPGEQVYISVESYSTDLDKANFVWKANGITIESGSGIKSVTFFAPESGKTLTLSLRITKEEGGVLNRTFTFSPADVDIIYEANTYTPPFYKGKSLFTSESEIRFIAMPNFVNSAGTSVNPDQLVYTWKVNDSVLQGVSGYGKRVFNTKGSLIQRATKIGVEVSAKNSSLQAKDFIYIQVKQPEILVYEKNPLLGTIYEKAVVGEFYLDRAEIELQSVPYFFSSNQKDNGYLDFTWKINGESVEFGSKNSSSSFRNETEGGGRARISLEVQHFGNILQLAETELGLNFTEQKNVIQNNFDF